MSEQLEEITSELAYIGEKLNEISNYLRKMSQYNPEVDGKINENEINE